MDAPVLRDVIPAVDPVTGVPAPKPDQRFALSPINRRRWKNFKAKRRGYWAVWVYAILFIASMIAE